MKNSKTKIGIITGSIIIYLGILFLSIAINSPFLAVIGLAVAPANILYFNKNFIANPIKYYSVLVIAVLVTLSLVVCSKNTNANAISTNNDNSILAHHA